MSQKKKYLILGPINQWGGVNIDVGFIAKVLKTKGNDVFVLSYGTYYEDASIFQFIEKKEYSSIDRELANNHLLVKVSLKVLQLTTPP